MTQTVVSNRRADPVTVRSYRPEDHNACRQLWAELTAEYRALYPGRPYPGHAPGEGAGASDPGAGFEEYLTRLDLSGMWVAQQPEGQVVGFVGLILQGRAGSVDPVVVTAGERGQGIGRALLAHVAERARSRGMRELSLSPALRNAGALHCAYRAGWATAATVTLTLDLTGQPRTGTDAVDVHGIQFGY